MVKRFLFQCLLLLAMALAATPIVAVPEVHVELKKNNIAENERFLVTFKVFSATNAAEPDWTPLRQDFKILKKSKSYSFQSINGQQQSVTAWNLELMPRRSGHLMLPSLLFGRQASKPRKIRVRSISSAKKRGKEDIYIEVSAGPRNPYVQQQVRFVFKVFMTKNLRGNLTQPSFKGNVTSEPLPEKNYRINRKGRNYRVHERIYMLYPQASGAVRINPIVLTGQYTEKGRRFSVTKRSKTLQLNVRPVPLDFTGSFWLPANGVRLQQKWSDDLSQWVQGDPLTWTIKLIGKSLLASQLPAVEIPQPEGFNVYTDAKPVLQTIPDGSGLRGERAQKFVLIPTQSGEHVFPEIKIPWWNTRTDQLEYAILAEQNVQIQPAAVGQLTMETPPSVFPQEMNQDSVKVDAIDYIWIWISGILGFGWLVTLIWITRERFLEYIQRRSAGQSHAVELKKVRKDVEAACMARDTCAVRDALLKWARVMWRDYPPRSLDDIMQRCTPGLKKRIQAFDQAAYGHGRLDPDSLWQAVLYEPAEATGTKLPKETSYSSPLEPLYK